jgi:hypothetical protein
MPILHTFAGNVATPDVETRGDTRKREMSTTDRFREHVRREFASVGLDAALEIDGFDTMTIDQLRSELVYLADFQG